MGDSLCKAESYSDTKWVVSIQSGRSPQKTSAKPTERTDGTTESRLNDKKLIDSHTMVNMYMLPGIACTIYKTTKVNFEVQTEKEAFFLKPTYMVQELVGREKFVMHPTTCLADMEARGSRVNDAHIQPQWRRSAQQLPTPRLLPATNPPGFVLGAVVLIFEMGDLQVGTRFSLVNEMTVNLELGIKLIDQFIASLYTWRGESCSGFQS